MNETQINALAAKLTTADKEALHKLASEFGSAGGFAGSTEAFAAIGDGVWLKILLDNLPMIFDMILRFLNRDAT